METTVNYDDTKRGIVAVQPSGDWYIAEWASVWHNNECVGTQVLRCEGPLGYRDLPTTQPSAELFDWIDAYEFGSDVDTEADAEWLQAQDEAGMLTMPFGLR